jgi:hypothetical protein
MDMELTRHTEVAPVSLGRGGSPPIRRELPGNAIMLPEIVPPATAPPPEIRQVAAQAFAGAPPLPPCPHVATTRKHKIKIRRVRTHRGDFPWPACAECLASLVSYIRKVKRKRR